MLADESKEYATAHACSLQCPLGTVPEGYVNLIAERKFDLAYEVIRELNPLPSTCSMICHHPCEEDCKRGLLRDEPIAIRALKRFVLENTAPKPLKFDQQFDQKIAIIGAGPAGLTAAADLAAKGYKVKIFEAAGEPGGMAKRAIPDFRIDKKKLAEEIQLLIDAGVAIEYGCRIGKNPSIKQLLDDRYGAILIAVGASQGVKLPIPGADGDQVYDALSLMQLMNAKQVTRKRAEGGRRCVIGDKAVVIGGGSVAMDTARALKRLGLDVTCVCLESGGEVPAPAWELAEAKADGVELIEGVSPVQILVDLFEVKGIELKKVESIGKDERGRLRPVTIDGSEFTLDCDTVVFATGQKTDIRFLADGGNLKTDGAGRIAFNADTLETSNSRVFVAGDIVEARGSVISAMASGRKAALSLDNLLQGRNLIDSAAVKTPHLAPNEEKIFPAVRLERLDPQPVPKREFKADFEQVELVYDEEAAVAEAKRCMKCGYSIVDTDECLGCGVCVKLCPERAISLVKIES
jgi:formate dehydrogenase beta subunit